MSERPIIGTTLCIESEHGDGELGRVDIEQISRMRSDIEFILDNPNRGLIVLLCMAAKVNRQNRITGYGTSYTDQAGYLHKEEYILREGKIERIK